MPKKLVPMIGTIQWIVLAEVQPLQNRAIGMKKAEMQAGWSRTSGLILPSLLSVNWGSTTLRV
jgi:hypothetical protein